MHQLALLCSFSSHDGLFLPITIVKVFQLGFSSSIENKALPSVPALPNLCLLVRLRVPVKIDETSISFGCGIGSQIWIQTYWQHILNQAWRLLSSKVLLRSRMGPCLCLIHVQGVIMLRLDWCTPPLNNSYTLFKLRRKINLPRKKPHLSKDFSWLTPEHVVFLGKPRKLGPIGSQRCQMQIFSNGVITRAGGQRQGSSQ